MDSSTKNCCNIHYLSSFSNPKLKFVSSLFQKKARDETKSFVIEGEKFVNAIPSHWECLFYVLSQTFANQKECFLYAKQAEVFVVPDQLFQKLSETVSPQGILAVCKQKRFEANDLFQSDNFLLLMLEQTNDPGNLGAMFRVAHAAGSSGVVLSKGSVDVYNPKVLRASAGSLFAVPFLTDVHLPSFLKELLAMGTNIYAARGQAQNYPYAFDLTQKTAFLIGNEGHGLSDEVLCHITTDVRIPMAQNAESLNAAVACGILMYEAVRQRLVVPPNILLN